MSKKLHIVIEVPEGSASCAQCMLNYNLNDHKTCGCTAIHEKYISSILQDDPHDPKYDNHPFELCNRYDFSNCKVKLITVYDDKK